MRFSILLIFGRPSAHRCVEHREMQEILAALGSHFGSEWVVKSFDGWSLRLCSGTSPEYATPTVEFLDVAFMSCPFEFSHPAFRVATSVELKQVQCFVPLDAGDTVVAIEAETMAGLGKQTFFLVAAAGRLLR